ncbi:hypothetical protein ACQEU6_46125 [Spirillospora sp. CA-108201]
MADEGDEARPRPWVVRRWAAPVALAVSVAASAGAVHLPADGSAATAAPPGERRMPRFIVAVGTFGSPSQGRGPEPWFQGRAVQPGGGRPVDSVPAPRSAGAARSLIAGPGGGFVLSTFDEKTCTTRFHRFRLTCGRVKDLGPLVSAAVPARVAGLAMSPDGERLAYATAPCAKAAQPRASVTVLDLGSGRTRAWSAAAPSLVGEIVWAGDGRTLGCPTTPPRPPRP